MFALGMAPSLKFSRDVQDCRRLYQPTVLSYPLRSPPKGTPVAVSPIQPLQSVGSQPKELDLSGHVME